MSKINLLQRILTLARCARIQPKNISITTKVTHTVTSSTIIQSAKQVIISKLKSLYRNKVVALPWEIQLSVQVSVTLLLIKHSYPKYLLIQPKTTITSSTRDQDYRWHTITSICLKIRARQNPELELQTRIISIIFSNRSQFKVISSKNSRAMIKSRYLPP